MKKIKIIKNRSDIGAGTRGSDMGIDAIEIAAINANNNYFAQFDFEEGLIGYDMGEASDNDVCWARCENIIIISD